MAQLKKGALGVESVRAMVTSVALFSRIHHYTAAAASLVVCPVLLRTLGCFVVVL